MTRRLAIRNSRRDDKGSNHSSRHENWSRFAGRIDLERQGKYAASSQVILAVLAVIAALYLLKAILVPIAVALVLACMFYPLAAFFRRWFPLRSARALWLFPAARDGRALPGQPGSREPLPRGAHAAGGHRAAGGPGERPAQRPAPRPALSPRGVCPSRGRSTAWATPTVRS